MPRFNVEHGEKIACFSTVVDRFVTNFMEKDEYKQWRIDEYGINNYVAYENCNLMNLSEAISIMLINESTENIYAHLVDIGITKSVAKRIICQSK